MVKIFGTDIVNPNDADDIIRKLANEYPDFRINFDLEDCDNILRVEAKDFRAADIIRCVISYGYKCTEID